MGDREVLAGWALPGSEMEGNESRCRERQDWGRDSRLVGEGTTGGESNAQKRGWGWRWFLMGLGSRAHWGRIP